MKKLKINLNKNIDNSYDIIFTEKVGEKLSNFLLENNKRKILIVSDSNVYPLHFYNLLSNINSEIEVFSFEIKAGEENKNIETVLNINKKLIEKNFNRGDLLIALGGGVVGDIVGFSASIFKRGIDFIQIPTTLLSMFDSSVGGKTGVDFDGIKNIIGAFRQPKLVLINSEYLETLPKKEILSGYFEGLKHSLIKSEDYFNKFKKENSSVIPFLKGDYLNYNSLKLNEFIKENVLVKAEIVMEDEKEMGIRKFLNYGHTFGHAVESITDFQLSHGVCVGLGMIYVNILSNKLGYLSDNNLFKINNFILNKLNHIDLSKFNLDFSNIYNKMLSDKKNNSSEISFILLEKPGKLLIEKIGKNKKKLLEEIFNKFVNKII